MNIETANRLYELRKKNGLSQEELADKLGISRQAVSKWERAEASPDTDNLILLAKLYGITLDELLNGYVDYINYYTIGKYLFDTYDRKYILKLLKDKNLLEEQTPRIYEETKLYIKNGRG